MFEADRILHETFVEQRSQYEAAAEGLEEVCGRICRDLGLKDAWVSSRVKDFGSAADKFEAMRKQGQPYGDIADVPDLAGVRIVVDDRVQTARITRQALKELDVELDQTFSRRLAVDQLGYRARHLIVRWGVGRSRHIRCELQIRSLMQHAWAQTQRNLGVYKGDFKPAQRIRRVLNIISGQLEALDTTLEGAIIDDELLHAHPEPHNRLTAAALQSFASSQVLRSLLARGGFNLDTVRTETVLNEKQMRAIAELLMECDVRNVRAVAVDFYDSLPLVQEALNWPSPIRIGDPVLLLLVGVLTANQRIQALARVPFMTAQDREDLARPPRRTKSWPVLSLPVTPLVPGAVSLAPKSGN